MYAQLLPYLIVFATPTTFLWQERETGSERERKRGGWMKVLDGHGMSFGFSANCSHAAESFWLLGICLLLLNFLRPQQDAAQQH